MWSIVGPAPPNEQRQAPLDSRSQGTTTLGRLGWRRAIYLSRLLRSRGATFQQLEVVAAGQVWTEVAHLALEPGADRGLALGPIPGTGRAGFTTIEYPAFEIGSSGDCETRNEGCRTCFFGRSIALMDLDLWFCAKSTEMAAEWYLQGVKILPALQSGP